MRKIGSILTLVFVAVSGYLLWPSLKTIAPKLLTEVQVLSGQVFTLIDQNKKTDTSKEVKGESTTGFFINDLDESITSSGVIAETNSARASSGLAPLLYNDKLSRSAMIKVNDMITKQYFEHASPTGVTVSDLGNEVGYSYITIGENLALGDFTSNNDVVTAWMKSPGHRANILNTKYTEIGVAARKATYQGNTVWFVVQHFGAERTMCPDVDQNLKLTIDSLRARIKSLEDRLTTMRTALQKPDAPIQPNYQQKVDAYNSLAKQYEDLNDTVANDIGSYNTEVRSFNKCLSKYQ